MKAPKITFVGAGGLSFGPTIKAANVPNRGYLPNVDEGAIVEVGTKSSASRPRTCRSAQLPEVGGPIAADRGERRPEPAT